MLQSIFLKTKTIHIPHMLIWSRLVCFLQKYCTQKVQYHNNICMIIFKKWEPLKHFLKKAKHQIWNQHAQLCWNKCKTLLLFFVPSNQSCNACILTLQQSDPNITLTFESIKRLIYIHRLILNYISCCSRYK